MQIGNPRLISIGHLQPRSDWHIRAHAHAFHQLIVLMDGGMTVRLRDRELHAQAGDLLLYPEGARHEEWADAANPVESYYLGLAWDRYQPHLPLKVHDPGGRMRQLAAWLYQDRTLNVPHVVVQRENFVRATVAQFMGLCQDDLPEHHLIAMARQFIHEHLDGPLTLAMLAEHVQLSKYYFVRLFRRYTGRTPMAEARAQRLEHARDLVLTTDLPLKRIARQTGLSSEYVLCRLFRQYFGTTPGQLRRGAPHAP